MRTISTALLSYGLSGKVFHAPFIQAHPGYTLAGCWERSKRHIENDYPGTRSYRSLEEILGDPSIDLVVVNTPTNTHFDFAQKALLAGKHVLVEKAFTNNADEAVELDRLAKEKRLVLSVYQNRRWDSDFLAVRQVLDDQLLGDIVEAQIAFDRFNPSLSPKSHRESPGLGAGNLMDLGPHVVDIALVLFGMPEAVFGDLRACRNGSLVDDYFEVLLYYPRLRVRLHSSYLVREAGPGFLIHGTQGTLMKNRSDIQETQLRQGMIPTDAFYGIEPPSAQGVLYKRGIDSQDPIESPRGNYLGYFDQLHKALTEGAPVPVSGEEGIRVMRVLDAAAESSRSGQVIRL
jgi:predicted dehydrogenase